MAKQYRLRFSQRMRRDLDFAKARQEGRNYRCPFFGLYVRRRESTEEPADLPRIGISASRKVGNAPTRNKVKRRLREIFRLNQEAIAPGIDIALSIRRPATSASYAELEQRFMHALKYTGSLGGGEDAGKR